MNDTTSPAEPRSILVTGGNRGIGLEVVRQLTEAGHTVCITARKEADGRQASDAVRNAAGAVSYVLLDLASFAATRRCADALRERGTPWDVVLHNAGVLLPPEQRQLTEDGIEMTLQVNTIAPVLLTRLLRPLLSNPARLVWTGSGLHVPGSRGAEVDLRLDDLNLDANYHPQRAYKNSKLAQLWVSRQLQRRFGSEGLQSDVVCPGFVPSTAAAQVSGLRRFGLKYVLPRMPFATSLSDAAKRLVDACLAPAGEPGGRYFHGGALSEPSDDARDEERAERFFARATELVADAQP